MAYAAKQLQKMLKCNGESWLLGHVLEEKLTLSDFSIRDLAQQLIPDGHEYLQLLEDQEGERQLEAIDAVDTSAFSHIIGQIMFTAIQDAMTLDTLIGDKLVADFPSKILDKETLPGISAVSDEFDTPIGEGKPYPSVGMSEEYISIPKPEKRGGILNITREALIADRTGVLVERARSIGEGLAINREKRILNVVIGAVNPYARNGVDRNTYHDTDMGFDNIIVDQLVDFTDIQAADERFHRMRDPNTGEPLGVAPTTILTVPALMWTAHAILHDTTAALTDRANAVGQISSQGTNRVPYNLELLSNEWFREQLLAGIAASKGQLAGLTVDRTWIMGNFKKAFLYKTIWPLSVVEAPANNEMEFTADVWMRFKCSEFGVAGVREPRLVIFSGS